MVARIPVYVEAVKPAGGGSFHRCRPLFFDYGEARGLYLQSAMNRLTVALAETIAWKGRKSRHDELAAMVFSPPVKTRQCEFSFALRQHIVKCRFLFVSFAARGRVIAFTPSVSRLWFEVTPGESLAAKAERAIKAHFQRLVKRDRWTYDRLDALSLTGRAWVTTVSVSVRPRQRTGKTGKALAELSGGDVVDGADELRRCGRSLEWLYPDELDLPLFRGDGIDRLVRLLAADDRRPVALVGPRMVGKTAIVHGAVRKRWKPRPPWSEDRRVWLLSPQRLISGMMYVGQWEQRLLAIVNEAATATTCCISTTCSACTGRE